MHGRTLETPARLVGARSGHFPAHQRPPPPQMALRTRICESGRAPATARAARPPCAASSPRSSRALPSARGAREPRQRRRTPAALPPGVFSPRFLVPRARLCSMPPVVSPAAKAGSPLRRAPRGGGIRGSRRGERDSGWEPGEGGGCPGRGAASTAGLGWARLPLASARRSSDARPASAKEWRDLPGPRRRPSI